MRRRHDDWSEDTVAWITGIALALLIVAALVGCEAKNETLTTEPLVKCETLAATKTREFYRCDGELFTRKRP